MLKLEAVSVLGKVGRRMMNMKFDAITICNSELSSWKFERRFERDAILGALADRGWLRSYAQVERKKSQVFAGSERDSGADAFIHRPADVTSKSEYTQQHQTDLLVERYRKLCLGPDLSVAARRAYGLRVYG